MFKFKEPSHKERRKGVGSATGCWMTLSAMTGPHTVTGRGHQAQVSILRGPE